MYGGRPDLDEEVGLKLAKLVLLEQEVLQLGVLFGRGERGESQLGDQRDHDEQTKQRSDGRDLPASVGTEPPAPPTDAMRTDAPHEPFILP